MDFELLRNNDGRTSRLVCHRCSVLLRVLNDCFCDGQWYVSCYTASIDIVVLLFRVGGLAAPEEICAEVIVYFFCYHLLLLLSNLILLKGLNLCLKAFSPARRLHRGARETLGPLPLACRTKLFFPEFECSSSEAVLHYSKNAISSIGEWECSQPPQCCFCSCFYVVG